MVIDSTALKDFGGEKGLSRHPATQRSGDSPAIWHQTTATEPWQNR